jgi:hypothetical protein
VAVPLGTRKLGPGWRQLSLQETLRDSLRQDVRMRLRPDRTLEQFRNAVENLELQVDNFVAWSAGPNHDGLQNEYLRWVRDAEAIARRHLFDVPADQFATVRWRMVVDNTVPFDRFWSVVEGDAKSQLDWFSGVLAYFDGVGSPNVDTSGDGLWRDGQIRAFISHLASEKEFAGAVSDELATIGIQGFVAHDTIDPSLEWQAEIERALRTAHVFVGLVHPGFSASFWTQQEVGWAVGRVIPLFTVRLGEDPRGFSAKFQAPSMIGRGAWQVATAVAVWLSQDVTFGATVTNRLMSEVRNARSYKDAEAAALRVEQMGKLSASLLDELERAYLSNDELYPYHVGARVVDRILETHGRSLPTRSE